LLQRVTLVALRPLRGVYRSKWSVFFPSLGITHFYPLIFDKNFTGRVPSPVLPVIPVGTSYHYIIKIVGSYLSTCRES
jgi:hypothetical protein